MLLFKRWNDLQRGIVLNMGWSFPQANNSSDPKEWYSMTTKKEVVSLISWQQVFGFEGVVLGVLFRLELICKHWHINKKHQFYKHTLLHVDKCLRFNWFELVNGNSLINRLNHTLLCSTYFNSHLKSGSSKPQNYKLIFQL